ncbi:MAG: trimeric intracellular cation channel family protein [Eubacteriales bacterium]
MVLLNIFIFIGIVAAAISGALLGIKKQLDFFGIIVLGTATALGGGVIRDILLGYTPPVAFRQPVYTVVSVIAAILVMFFPKKFSNQTNIIMFFDAIGLGIFTAVGANLALQQKVSSTFIAVTIGVITGVGGGIIRDIFAQEIPLIFKKEVYATASIAGAFSLAYSRHFLSGMIPLYICFTTTLVIRLTALYFGIHQSVTANKSVSIK